MDSVDVLNKSYPQPVPSPALAHFLLLKERDEHVNSDAVGGLWALPLT